MLLPSSWIHAVYTPEDTIAFGGNFLHSLNIADQFNIHSLESRTHVQHKFRFPFFAELMFYGAAHIIQRISETKLTKVELDNLPPLIHQLRKWLIMPEEDVESKLSVAEAASEAASMVGFKSASDMIDHLEKQCCPQKTSEGKLRIKLSLNKCRTTPNLENSNLDKVIPEVTPQHHSIDDDSDFNEANSNDLKINVPQTPVFQVKKPKKKKQEDEWRKSKPKKQKKLSYPSMVNAKKKIPSKNLISYVENPLTKTTQNLSPLDIKSKKNNTPYCFPERKFSITKNHFQATTQFTSNKVVTSNNKRSKPASFNSSIPQAKVVSVYDRLKKRI